MMVRRRRVSVGSEEGRGGVVLWEAEVWEEEEEGRNYLL